MVITIKIYIMAGILDLVGNTPLVELKALNPNPNVQIYGKLEGNNPGGSVKDRAAIPMTRDFMYEESARLREGDEAPEWHLARAAE